MPACRLNENSVTVWTGVDEQKNNNWGQVRVDVAGAKEQKLTEKPKHKNKNKSTRNIFIQKF